MKIPMFVIKPLFCLFVGGLLSNPLWAQDKVFADSVLTAKNFPLLACLKQEGKLQKQLRKSATFREVVRQQAQRTQQALDTCTSTECYTDGLKWTGQDIAAIEKELIRLLERKKTFRRMIFNLRTQGTYALYDSLPDTALVSRAWRDVANGINRIFDVYVKGVAPRYAKIDSISFGRNDTGFNPKVRLLLQINRSKGRNALFFEEPLHNALDVLALNGRNEAARYEPMSEGLNQAPFQKIKNTDFSAYPYSVILVPGLGPEDPAVLLDPQGARRCEEGVKRYRQGLAPFIVVSGGNVHPFKTPYNEAEEMKKYIVEQLKVPADVVFIEPHARHTTTNIRNTSRMIYRFGLPAEKPVLIVTDASQNSYIHQRMGKTAMRDLGYLPYDRLKKLSEQETEFYPLRTTLQADPFDPLDP